MDTNKNSTQGLPFETLEAIANVVFYQIISKMSKKDAVTALSLIDGYLTKEIASDIRSKVASAGFRRAVLGDCGVDSPVLFRGGSAVVHEDIVINTLSVRNGEVTVEYSEEDGSGKDDVRLEDLPSVLSSQSAAAVLETVEGIAGGIRSGDLKVDFFKDVYPA